MFNQHAKWLKVTARLPLIANVAAQRSNRSLMTGCQPSNGTLQASNFTFRMVKL